MWTCGGFKSAQKKASMSLPPAQACIAANLSSSSREGERDRARDLISNEGPSPAHSVEASPSRPLLVRKPHIVRKSLLVGLF